jgi:hypothetical protein
MLERDQRFPQAVIGEGHAVFGGSFTGKILVGTQLAEHNYLRDAAHVVLRVRAHILSG